MGNIFSTQSRQISQTDLETRIINLEHLDRNHDKVVTKEEFTQWIEDLRKQIRDQQHLYQTQTSALQLSLDQLKAERESLKVTNETLTKNVTQLEAENRELIKKLRDLFESGEAKASGDFKLPDVNANDNVGDHFSFSPESKQILEHYVEDLLQNPDTNINYFPDFVERRLYRNIFKMFLGLIDKVTTSTSINFLGHSIHLSLAPVSHNDITSRTIEVETRNEVEDQPIGQAALASPDQPIGRDRNCEIEGQNDIEDQALASPDHPIGRDRNCEIEGQNDIEDQALASPDQPIGHCEIEDRPIGMDQPLASPAPEVKVPTVIEENELNK